MGHHMRRKITPVELVEAGADLPDLTSQQQKFVEGILAGKTGAQAYREAYDCSNTSSASVWCLASRLRSDVKVASWLSAARQAHLGTTKITKDMHVSRLEELRELAVKSGNVGAAVQAEQLIGKVEGHYTEQVSVKVDDPSDSLDAIAKISPELAQFLAQEHKLEQWQPEQPKLN